MRFSALARHLLLISTSEGTRNKHGTLSSLPSRGDLNSTKRRMALIAQLEEVAVYTPADSNLNVANVKKLKRDINRLIHPGGRLVIDLGQVQWLDSAACGTLLAAYRALREIGGELKLCSVRRPVRTLFELVRLHRVIDIFNTREEAMRSFAD